MPRSATYETVYPITAEQYYDLMLSRSFQRDVHVHGLRMSRWEAEDVHDDSRSCSRTVYSEPRLNLPKWLARVARKSQAYTEYSRFDREALRRTTRVVPKYAANMMEMSVEERYVDQATTPRGERLCVVYSTVRVRAKARLFRNMFEKWLLEQSALKVGQRDGYVLNALKERSLADLMGQADEETDGVVDGEGFDTKDTKDRRALVRTVVATAFIAAAQFFARELKARERRNSNRR